MLSVINIWPIFKRHFETLKEDVTTKGIILFFIIIPFLISLLLTYFGFLITSNILNSLIATFSILTGFNINILVLLIGTKKMKTDIENKLIKHLSCNILYELIVGLLILTISVVLSIILQKITNIVLYFSTLAIYFMVFNFLLTLLMISKRIYALLYMKLKDRYVIK